MNFPDGAVGLFDRRLMILSAGGKLLEEVGIDPGELEGLAVAELFDVNTRSMLLPACRNALEGRRRSFVLTFAGRTLEITVAPITEDGEVTGGLATAHDVSRLAAQYRSLEQRHLRSEYALREYERLLYSTFMAIGDTLMVVDGERTVVMSNIAGAEYSKGTEHSEGSRCYELLMGRDEPCADCPLAQVFRSGEQAIHELEEGGRYKRVYTHPIFNDAGEVELVVEHVQDITEQRRTEQRLRVLTDSLEERVRERTRELETSVFQLENEIERRKRAEERRKLIFQELKTANRELESFSYTVSHDLRAPLRSIKGYSRVVLEECASALGAEGREYLRRILSGSERMESLIDAILTLSRIDRRTLSCERVDLSALFHRSAEARRQEWPGREVQSYIEPGLIVYGDAKLLAAVADNLMENAWKYTAKKEYAQIRFGLIRRDGKKIYYLADNGAGFDMDASQNMFLPFRRLHSESEFPGLGVGLATVRRIITRHGGEVWAVGREGRGATFYFTIFPQQSGRTLEASPGEPDERSG
jgi:hypothetical protein